jgi:hypothetical protein
MARRASGINSDGGDPGSTSVTRYGERAMTRPINSIAAACANFDTHVNVPT